MTIIVTNGDKTETMTITEDQLIKLGKSIRTDWNVAATNTVIKKFIMLCLSEYWGEKS